MNSASIKNKASKKASYTVIELPKEGSLPAQLEHHLRLSANPCIKLICEPLKKIRIGYFLYVKRYKDASYVYLTNLPSWQNYYFSQRYYVISEFDDPDKRYQSGKFLWAGLSQQAIYSELRNRFNIDHGITLIQNYQDCCEFFHFGSLINNYEVVNFYLNNFALLKRFTLYFKDKAWEMIEAISNCRIKIPKGEVNTNSNSRARNEEILKYEELTKVNRYYVSNERSDVYLTHREMECLKWYSIGKTAEEIGVILGLSKRTIESYLAGVKNKINFYKKSSLGAGFLGNPLLNIT